MDFGSIRVDKKCVKAQSFIFSLTWAVLWLPLFPEIHLSGQIVHSAILSAVSLLD